MTVYQASLFDPVPPASTDEALTRISAHGWDQVGHPAGAWKRYTFRRMSGAERGQDEHAEGDLGDLAMWLEQLDAAATARQLRRRRQVSRRPAAALAGGGRGTSSLHQNFTFYLGTHEAGWIGRLKVPLFVSYSRIARRKSLPRASAPWAQDGNGFTVLLQHGAYQVPACEYARATERHQREIGMLDFASIQDWMCEPIMLQRTSLTIAEHQARTVRSFLALRELAPGVPWLPVLQGWHLDDYLRCAERYDRAGVDLAQQSRVGVGSVCRRQRTGEAEHIFSALAGLGLRLHAFGVKTLGLKRYAPALASADSLAWSYNARRHPPLDGCTHQNCSNCPRWALRWRERALAGLDLDAPQQLGLAL